MLVLAIIQLIRKGKLREEYALIWLGAGLAILILAVFGGIVSFFARLFAVSYAPTLLLVLGLFFALVILLSQSVVISVQADNIRDLAQTVTLMEWRLRRLETASSAGAETLQPALDRLSDPGQSGAQREPLIEQIS
jgi:uncharacterized membrane protein (Fun14 family)